MIQKVLSVFTGRRALHPLILIAVLIGSTVLLRSGGMAASRQVPFRPDPLAHDPYLVKDIITRTQGIFNREMIRVDDMLFMAIDDGEHGLELWKSDGTEAGTLLVKDIDPDSSSWPEYLTGVNEVLYFAAADDVHGSELWKSDGMEAGTVMVKDIYLGLGNGIDEYSQGLMLNYQEILYFTGNDGIHGHELWKSDGTEAGTVLVKDIDPGGDEYGPYSSFPRDYIEIGGIMFFAASTDYGEDLWKSDGSEAGTVLVKDITPYDYYGACPSHLTSLDGNLFFTADDGIHGVELWKSDGSEAGTNIVRDINPDIYWPGPEYLTGFNGVLYFSADDGVSGQELWSSNGTADSTLRVKDINPNGSSYPVDIMSINNSLYFSAYDEIHGQEFWRSDGTEAGTLLVKDINQGPDREHPSGNSYPERFTGAGNTIFFAANDGVHRYEIWASDGTEPGTYQVKDINPDTESIEISAAAVMEE